MVSGFFAGAMEYVREKDEDEAKRAHELEKIDAEYGHRTAAKNAEDYRKQSEKDKHLNQQASLIMKQHGAPASAMGTITDLLKTYDAKEVNRMVTAGEISFDRGYSGGTTDYSNVPAGEVSPNAKRAYDFFIGKGEEPIMAAGLVGNIMVESGNGLDPNAVGDGGNAFGIAQMNGPRMRRLEKFAADRGIPVNALETQLEHLHWEATTTDEAAKYAKVKAMNPQTPEEAAKLLSVHYWRPGKPHLESRMKNAAFIHNSLFDDASGAEQMQGAFDDGNSEWNLGTPVDDGTMPMQEQGQEQGAYALGDTSQIQQASMDPSQPMSTQDGLFEQTDLAFQLQPSNVQQPVIEQPEAQELTQHQTTGMQPSVQQTQAQNVDAMFPPSQKALAGRVDMGGGVSFGVSKSVDLSELVGKGSDAYQPWYAIKADSMSPDERSKFISAYQATVATEQNSSLEANVSKIPDMTPDQRTIAAALTQDERYAEALITANQNDPAADRGRVKIESIISEIKSATSPEQVSALRAGYRNDPDITLDQQAHIDSELGKLHATLNKDKADSRTDTNLSKVTGKNWRALHAQAIDDGDFEQAYKISNLGGTIEVTGAEATEERFAIQWEDDAGNIHTEVAVATTNPNHFIIPGVKGVITPEQIRGRPMHVDDRDATSKMLARIKASGGEDVRTAKQELVPALVAAKELDDLVLENEDILTYAGGALPETIQSIGRNIESISKLVAGGGTRNDLYADYGIDANTINSSADQNARFKAKLLDFAFSYASVGLGQSGQGLSDNDFKKAFEIVAAGTNYETFSQNIRELSGRMIGKVQSKVDGLTEDPEIKLFVRSYDTELFADVLSDIEPWLEGMSGQNGVPMSEIVAWSKEPVSQSGQKAPTGLSEDDQMNDQINAYVNGESSVKDKNIYTRMESDEDREKVLRVLSSRNGIPVDVLQNIFERQ